MKQDYLNMSIVEMFEILYEAKINNNQEKINDIANTLSGALFFTFELSIDETRKLFGYKNITNERIDCDDKTRIRK